MRIQFTVPGVPVGKGRPRFTRGGHAYTPEKTAAFEEKVRLCWKTQSGETFPAGHCHGLVPHPQKRRQEKGGSHGGDGPYPPPRCG